MKIIDKSKTKVGRGGGEGQRTGLQMLLVCRLPQQLTHSCTLQGAKETRMIENEVKIMQSLDHPNCIKLYDVSC